MELNPFISLFLTFVTTKKYRIMKKFLLSLTLLSAALGFSQVLIDDTGASTGTPNASAALEVKSNDKGLLLPRMATAPASPAEGLIFFDTAEDCFKGYNGTEWQALSDCTPVVSTDYTISIADATAVTEGADQTFTVTLSPALVAGDVITVDYTSADGTASSGTDYTAASATLTFNTVGQTTQDITITTLTDTDETEGNENYTVTLTNAGFTGSGSATIDTTTPANVGTGTINDAVSSSSITQGFDGSGSWGYTLSTPTCNTGGDTWDIVSSPWNGITMTNDFFGVKDLTGDCGGSAGETITFDQVTITTETTISFDYNVFEFDTGDDVFYTVTFNGVPQTQVQLIDGNNNLSASGTETISIPTGTTTVSFELLVDQNGGGDYAGFDNFSIQ